MESNTELELKAAKEDALKALCSVSESLLHINHIEAENPSLRVVNYALSKAHDAVKIAIREIEEFTLMHPIEA